MPEHIRFLKHNEHHLIGKIIADGFTDDPVNLWAFRNTGAMKPVFTTMANHLYLSAGFGLVNNEENAGALWLPPGAPKQFSLLADIKMGVPILKHGGLKAVQNSLQIDAYLKKKKPKEPHYYLFAISVHPSLQGKGIGSQLMKEALKQVDETRAPAYLESSKPENVPFYKKHGFEIMEEVVPGTDCPPMWLMWREPRL
ncbi:GNAT family N-acetyltransferase [Kordiimonas sp. SCSIO 12603]|uniref:GNAT family N-acetyltransferase n=1 Tax=Kordiimonas sp. SCSIO 12603 TaxID=2829596 RepID=UPI002101E366|nr:GNAT family N-acetyltransferase [Kordiimonas sp. SCSIO 12603]UTW58668.1 GNAT family N-acetyltransferase [Kordiimonas sp. SCSIO 12603]